MDAACGAANRSCVSVLSILQLAPYRLFLMALCSTVEQAVPGSVQSEALQAALDDPRRCALPGANIVTLDHFWSAAGEWHDSVRLTWICAKMAIIETWFSALEAAG